MTKTKLARIIEKIKVEKILAENIRNVYKNRKHFEKIKELKIESW
ncbi:MAG: hypothetical protein Q7S92_00700 [Candidatus Diapherotrites archaeon]|nr:hypothetical protein [Candidatus Diapherotrites archaeon]